jgi:hypothetical protein
MYRKALLTAGAVLALLGTTNVAAGPLPSGQISAGEDCTRWSAQVSVDHITRAERLVVLTSIPGTTGFSGHRDADVLTVLWNAFGFTETTGTVTLQVWSGSHLDLSVSQSIAPPISGR